MTERLGHQLTPKTDMRRELARQPFEQKIRQVGQLIKLSATVKSSRVREEAQVTQHPSQTRAHIAEASVDSKLRPPLSSSRARSDEKSAMNTASSGSGRVDDIKGHPQGEIRGQTKLVKTIPRLLLVSCLLLAMVSAQEALADGCSSGKCPFASVAPYVPPAPATASASRGFTAIGGTRVADVNLSPEGLARLAAGDKEEPLPKGCSTAADRAKLFAEPSKPREARPFTRRSVARPATPATAVKVKSSAFASRQ